MNSLALVILLFMVLMKLFSWSLDYLNVRHAETKGLPDELRNAYSPERYRDAIGYLKDQSQFGFWQGFVDFGVFAGFWWLGCFSQLDRWSRSFGQNEVVTGLIFFSALFVLQGIIGLPWRIYHTFVLEERFGFNRTTPKTFVSDMLKGALLGAVIGLPILAAVEWFFISAGEVAWLWVWGFLAIVQVVLPFVAPIWLMPLFYKFSPLEKDELRQAIEEYAARVGFSLGGIFVIDGSRRSNKANAFFTGFGKTKRIALFDTLVNKSSVQEIVAVLAHEVGHSKRGHIVKGFILSLASSALMFFILGKLLAWPAIYEAFFVDTPSVYTGLVFVSILYSPLSLLLGFLTSAISRKFEFEADHFAGTTADPKAMVRALEKLTESNLSNPNPHPWVVALEYSHPPTVERIRALAKI